MPRKWTLLMLRLLKNKNFFYVTKPDTRQLLNVEHEISLLKFSLKLYDRLRRHRHLIFSVTKSFGAVFLMILKIGKRIFFYYRKVYDSDLENKLGVTTSYLLAGDGLPTWDWDKELILGELYTLPPKPFEYLKIN